MIASITIDVHNTAAALYYAIIFILVHYALIYYYMS